MVYLGLPVHRLLGGLPERQPVERRVDRREQRTVLVPRLRAAERRQQRQAEQLPVPRLEVSPLPLAMQAPPHQAKSERRHQVRRAHQVRHVLHREAQSARPR